MKTKLLIISTMFAVSFTAVRAESSMEQAQGQLETYEALLSTSGGRDALARVMVSEYRKAAQASIESIDQISDRRLAEFTRTFHGSDMAAEMEGDPSQIREKLKTMITQEERIVSETITATIGAMSDDEARRVLASVKTDFAAHAAQNFSVGDALKKVVSVIAKGIGAGAFIIGGAIRFPIVFTWHFLKNAFGTGVEKTGEWYSADKRVFDRTIFKRYLRWVAGQLEKESDSWDEFTRKWRREIPEEPEQK